MEGLGFWYDAGPALPVPALSIAPVTVQTRALPQSYTGVFNTCLHRTPSRDVPRSPRAVLAPIVAKKNGSPRFGV